MEENKLYCSYCGSIIDTDDYSEINGEIICTDCVERYCCTCDEYGDLIFDDDTYGDDITFYVTNAMRNIILAVTAMTA